MNKNVLIPRFDTEKLVETVIVNASAPGFRVLELCTGSGCVAVVLARHGADVVAVDISGGALRVARRNARLHDADIKFVKSDLFAKVSGRFDAIVCNPPYVKSAELGKWDKTTLAEPRIALDGGEEGLDFYRRIIARAGEFLVDGGAVFFEMDYRQGKDIAKMLADGGFCDIKTCNDAQGLERVIWARTNISRN